MRAMRLHIARVRLPARRIAGRRYVQIAATPVSETPADEAGGGASPDAKFEVLGSPYSLLSVNLSPSQNLYTRRGTLVAVSGKAENAVSTLSILSPFRRAVFGVPFLYQKVTSPTPLSLLISTRTPTTSFSVIHLDGRLDWIIAQRNALLAWTGHNLSVTPKSNRQLPFNHWGQTHITGRGLLGLVGHGQIYQINLKPSETYIVHPSNIVAYSLSSPTSPSPRPFRFKSTTLKLSIPGVDFSKWLPDTRFWRTMKESAVWKGLRWTSYKMRTWSRRTIWGDRLFLRFEGPCTLLLQSRQSRIRDALSNEEVNEIADAAPGAVDQAVGLGGRKEEGHGSSLKGVAEQKPDVTKVHTATVEGGKVRIE